jgi:hypothetical protein
MDIATVQEWIPEFIIIRMKEISWYEFVLAIQELEDIAAKCWCPSSYLLLQNVPFLWIKPRLKEIYELCYKDSLCFEFRFKVVQIFKLTGTVGCNCLFNFNHIET